MYVTHDQEEAMTLGDRIVVMSNGEIQQCDAPLKVYQQPRNRFVAGFIGTPQMNFFNGRVKEDGSGLRFVEEGPEGKRLEFGLPPERRGLRSVVGKDVVLGLRPTMLRESPDGQEVRIQVVEPLGDAMDVSFETPSNGHVVARVPAHVGLTPGETMRLLPDAHLAHFFEPGEFGRNLSEGGR
jgi:multiple sugar transport system ATP-binding protein